MGRNPKTFDQAVTMFNKENYTLITPKESFKDWGSYVDTISPSGFPYRCKPSKFAEGKRCRKEGNASFGEMAIYFILLKTLKDGFRCEDEYRIYIEGDKRFDFAVIDPKGNVVLFIEFQGQQHYGAVRSWGGEKGLEERLVSDELKRGYCEKNNIPLLTMTFDLGFNEIYSQLRDSLKEVVIEKELDVADMPLLNKGGFTMLDVVNYYKTHTIKETALHFNINYNTVTRYSRQLGFSKKDFIKEILSNYVVNKFYM